MLERLQAMMPNQTIRVQDITNLLQHPSSIEYAAQAISDSKARFSFFVAGVPVPQGSKNARVIPKRGKTVNSGASGYRAIMYEQDKDLKKWRSVVKEICGRSVPDEWGKDGIFGNWSTFFFPRPDYHYSSNGSLKPKYKDLFYKRTKPDGDKCIRAINDSLSGVAFSDDAAVAANFALTAYANPTPPGALVTIVKLD